MYSIVMTNGNLINIKATRVEWYDKSRTLVFINNRTTVARINMDNIVGWIDAYYKAEGEENDGKICL